MSYIVAVLALAIPSIAAADSRMTTPKDDIQFLTEATETLVMHIGRVPEPEEWPEILLYIPKKESNWRGPYLRGFPRDPWGNSFVYNLVEPSELSGTAFTIHCKGPNGIDENGGGDDIGSWSMAGGNRRIEGWKRRVLILGVSIGLVMVVGSIWYRRSVSRRDAT